MTQPCAFLKPAGQNDFQRHGKQVMVNGVHLCDAADEEIGEFVLMSLKSAELGAYRDQIAEVAMTMLATTEGTTQH